MVSANFCKAYYDNDSLQFLIMSFHINGSQKEALWKEQIIPIQGMISRNNFQRL
jgi:hypothetical protein